ncbi:MAG TPA: acyl-CoA dehydrogenase family protein [Gaiellaceae bacterium]|nr:acyl-CoA dehydrogenase family protein [Gaiellaceae bacterium]
MLPGTAENQPPPLAGHDLFAQNRPLAEGIARAAPWALDRAHALGRELGGEPLEWGRLANEHPPILRTHDRYGNRIDEVEYHPAWHALMRMSVAHGLHALPWREPREGAHVARAALMMLAMQVEAGHGCPISMTFSSLPALRAQPDLAAEWEPRLTSLDYEAGALCGMAMTEKQGGSDVRANTTAAEPLGSGGEYALDGHKWFCSAPMSDAFLVLAQAPGGLSCFLVPRGEGFHLVRLKDKLGNRSNASAEIELHGARARLVGEEGRGVRTIIEMVNHTRLDCVLGTAAQMRAGIEQATWHAAHRSAFGRVLADQPLMENVLADLCVESEAATLTALRLAAAYDDPAQAGFRRIATAIAKYHVCKRGPAHAAEALECLGGNGYVEDSGLPRIYREQPLLSIWEGSGNVIALDVLRAIRREPDSLEAFLAALDDDLRPELGEPDEAGARRTVERLALALQGTLLRRHGDPAVAEAFFARTGGSAYGTLPPGLDLAAIVERHTPVL